MHFSTILLIGVLAVAVFTDIRTGKIRNWLTLPAAAAGPFVHLAQGGKHQAILSLAGMGVMILVAAVLAVPRIMGGGDLKLLVAVGSLAGLPLVKDSLLYTALAGGLVALVVLFRHQRAVVVGRDLVITIVRMFGRRAGAYAVSGVSGGRVKFPYSIAIAIGTTTAIYLAALA